VLLTAKGQEFDRQRGQEVGADLYMTKPFDPDALLEKAREVWGADVTTRVPLRRLLQRQEGAEALLTAVADALGGPVAVEDADGSIVHGPPGDGVRSRGGDHRRPGARLGPRVRARRGGRGGAGADTWRLATSSRRRSAPRCCTSIARSI
jgi:hypothetical protein